MSNLKVQINRLESTVKEYQEEQNELQGFIVIAKYIDLLKTIPESKDFLDKVNVDIAKHADEQEPIFDSMNDIPLLEITKDGVNDNIWFYYSFLNMISKSMNASKEAHNLQDKKPLLDLAKKHDIDPNEELDIKAVAPILNKETVSSFFFKFHEFFISDLHTRNFYEKDKVYPNLTFEENPSIFYFRGKPIEISKQARVTNQNRIMKYIFIDNRDNLDKDFFYSEMAEDLGEDKAIEKSKNWSKYRTALKELNNKICSDFFIYNSSAQGHVKINSKYL